ncbi:cobaltochelatase CobN subunit [Roseovarius nanhaiticus]|uniref:Cobaltochelatase CobN subunit n=1 Tax=Roseovarius nanhaiticus TaxID=573024 RepID=A0A1N7HNW0_9RHOB|nr:cobaltochelatase subunit CobN [Roseovarius nanhaiticus]SEL37999.1 cobaltochelatase CobN subunit [Roseovarius nanhaiticus]SIS26408.1 cobaltochelatase CobN subunit [Roseovarius nanhaiticus]
MHVVFRESHGLEETETPMDLVQDAADLVVLSLSDSDLGAFAEGWHQGGGPEGRLPTLRLANIVALKHPLSVDTYVEQTLSGAKGILIRLIGGVPYWPYGLQSIRALAQEKGIALAVLPADGRPDARLDDMSTLPKSTLRRLAHLCDTGGAVAAQAALAQLALAAGLYAGPVRGAKSLPQVGAWTPEQGACCPVLARASASALAGQPRVLIVFYRSYLVAADLAPIIALFDAFRARGFDVAALFGPSLKAPEAAGWLRRQVASLDPVAIVNATAFSGKGEGVASPLDAAGVPVFQVALATSTRKAWAEAERGLSPADLAMHVVLPEVDGRIMGGVASFKDPGKKDAQLQYSRFAHRAETGRIAAIADRVRGWSRLAATPPAQRRVALVLSTYPGKNWNMGHAVGLDAPQSAEAILSDLEGAGYDTGAREAPLHEALQQRSTAWAVAEYRSALARLPETLRATLAEVWGDPEDDPDCQNGAFHFAATRRGNAWIALQPERDTPKGREDSYHDLVRTPRHAYVAFYLWLQSRVDALVHIGAHGTLEWLPGKSVALSETCWPEVLTGALPVIYPFIVNDPGEAAQAKRRIGAVTLGHIPPPMRASGTPERLARLESLLDEFSNADGLDPRRRDRLQSDIRDEAQAQGVEDDLGLDRAGCSAEAITRIDRFVCDIKESQFGEGLHIWGRAPQRTAPFATGQSASAEQRALLDALDGRRIAAGPSGSPYRGRRDVLPTGRNLYTTDPRAVPTRAAYAQGVRLADELIRRHLQDEGDWPRGLIVDLWGSATMRTAGEEFAMALHLLGVRPVWDAGSERVSGIEVIPLTEMRRPRIDVTLRVSGLFRDVFPTLSALFAQSVRTLAARDEEPEWNPYAGREDLARVYGPRPGSFGLGMGAALEDYTEAGREKAGLAWLAASAWALDGEAAVHDTAGIRARVAQADSFVHPQDLPETDLLLASDYAAHEAGFAAAQAVTGGRAALYHLANTNPDHPRTRTLSEEIARVVRARAANPGWIGGMKQHGFRGAAEIAATLDHLASFAHLAGAVAPHLFDLYHDATLGDPETEGFLQDANPEAYRAMQARFAALLEAGLWQTRRNSVMAGLEAPA